MDSVQMQYGVEAELPENQFTRDGMTFAGWAVNVMSDAKYQDKERVKNLTIVENGRIVLYAKWEPSRCFITFDPQGGTFTNGSQNKKDAHQGQPVGEMPTVAMEKPQGMAGMQFDGWWTAPEGGSKVLETTNVPNGLSDITLYAHWLGVIRYEKVSQNTDQVVNIDENGVASGFRGELSRHILCALRSIEDDKFDFSGDFTIVMRCSRGTGAWRQDVFAGMGVPGSNNLLMDFGMSGSGPAQWEITQYRENGQTYGTHNISVGDVVYLCAQRRGQNVNCYVKASGGQFELDCQGTQGNYTVGRFYIGIDPDSLSEYFSGNVYLNDCYLIQENPNAAQPLGKYVLRPA